jgi:hypothetical protein
MVKLDCKMETLASKRVNWGCTMDWLVNTLDCLVNSQDCEVNIQGLLGSLMET